MAEPGKGRGGLLAERVAAASGSGIRTVDAGENMPWATLSYWTEAGERYCKSCIDACWADMGVEIFENLEI